MKTSTAVVLLFEGGLRPELQELRFSHRILAAPICAVRGRAFRPGNTEASFQWSAGIRAISLFLTRAALLHLEGNTSSPILEGGASTAAATLDYALSRQSNWLVDLFGSDPQGLSLARRFICRTNPERKRPGPVKLFLNSSFLAADCISIQRDGAPCNSAEALQDLCSELARGWSGSNVCESRSEKISIPIDVLPAEPSATDDKFFPRPFDEAAHRAQLSDMFRSELQSVLCRQSVFTEQGLVSSVKRIAEDPGFIRFAGKHEYFFAPMADPRSARSRLGFTDLELRSELESPNGEPLEVALPGGYVAGVAIFQFLRDFKKYPIKLNYQFVHAGEVIDHFQEQSSRVNSVAIIGDGHLSKFLSAGGAVEHRGMMMMPELSFQIVSAGKAAKGLNGGRYHILGGGKSSSLLYFERLLRSGVIKKKNIRVIEAAPDEVSTIFAESDSELKAVQWFPYYRLLELFNNCAFLIPQSDELRYRPNIMVGHQELLSNFRKRFAIEYAVRDAWLTLLESPVALASVIQNLTSSADYLRFLSRSAGFHFFRPERFQLPRIHSEPGLPQLSATSQ